MQQIFKHIKWMPLLMTVTILGIAGFQLYWLKKAYEREERTLEIRTNVTFRETIQQLQASKLKLDKLMQDSLRPVENSKAIEINNAEVRVSYRPRQKVMHLMNVINRKLKDSGAASTFLITERKRQDSGRTGERGNYRRGNDRLLQLLYEMDSVQDSIKINEIAVVHQKRMLEQNIEVPFTITRIKKEENAPEERVFNEVTIGFRKPITYRIELGNTFPHLLNRIIAPVLLSLFLVAFTIVSFSLLYKNLLRQRKLAEIKNEFISNITHELKTPIATVSVAIEAMRSFGAGMDTKKSKEYLDISANELQRLSLLVDKVLKLSMFENREIELKYEPLNMQELVAEVTSSMRLQFEKHRATVKVTTEGDTTLQGDRLHLVSVVFNLMDNALKYSRGEPQIDVAIKGGQNRLYLIVTDNGIGIPAEYKDKIFDKFFRVPTGNLHNAKGYGLGLSYVAHVVNKHHGTIKVESAKDSGSKFIISIPKQTA